MTSPSRRTFLQSSAGAALASALPGPALSQGAAAGTLRFVPQSNLTSLDPVWTTATVTGNHGYYVFDTLYSTNARGEPKPQMAEGHEVSADGRVWRITLRPGLKFHDNEPVRAADCVQSLKRWATKDPFGQLLAAVTEDWKAVDDRVLEIRLKKPFPLLLHAVGKAENACFMMPERLAKTDSAKQVTEMVGSGPYRFLPGEYVSGSRVVYEKFDGYVPRPEAPEFATGGKHALTPRIEWVVMPDPATAAAALIKGEIDWWERPLADLQPMLAKSPDIRREIKDKAGRLCLARLNCLHPPFNDVRLRRAVRLSVVQENYMQATQGDDRSAWAVSRSLWPNNTPYHADYPDMMPGDLNKAKAALKEAGYGGQKVVVINPTDYPDIGPLGLVTADTLGKAGMNVDMQESDWGTVIQRRTSREPVEMGGWSIFHTTGGANLYGSPATSTLVRGQGDTAWFGWWKSDKAEALTQDWLDAADEPTQRRVAAELDRLVLDEAPTIPLGQFTVRTAFRSNVQGLLEGLAPYPWNIRKG